MVRREQTSFLNALSQNKTPNIDADFGSLSGQRHLSEPQLIFMAPKLEMGIFKEHLKAALVSGIVSLMS